MITVACTYRGGISKLSGVKVGTQLAFNQVGWRLLQKAQEPPSLQARRLLCLLRPLSRLQQLRRFGVCGLPAAAADAIPAAAVRLCGHSYAVSPPV